MSIPLTTADLSSTSKNLKALVDGHPENTGGLLRLSGKWPAYSNFGPEVNPDAPAIGAYKN